MTRRRLWAVTTDREIFTLSLAHHCVVKGKKELTFTGVLAASKALEQNEPALSGQSRAPVRRYV